MDNSILHDILSGQVLLLALGMTRLTVCFLLLPLFSDQLIPPLVRNSIIVSLSLVIVSVHPSITVDYSSGGVLLRLFATEALLGIAIGFIFGLFLWAFDAAGEIVDMAIGSSVAMIHDPISGNEVTLLGEFLGRWAAFLFMAAGGLALVAALVLQSFAIWPLGSVPPSLSATSVELFQTKFSEYFALMLMIASPCLIIIFVIDMSMGLVNRFAQQLNVLFLSISIKSLVAIAVLALILPTLSDVLISELVKSSEDTLAWVKGLFVQ